SVVSMAQAVVLNASEDTSVAVLYTTRGTDFGVSLKVSDESGTATRAATFAAVPESARVPSARSLVSAQEELEMSYRQVQYTASRDATLAAVPESARVPSDRYLVSAQEELEMSYRKVQYTTYGTDNLSVSMPAPFEATFSHMSSPYTRPSYTLPHRAEAAGYT